MKSNCNDYFDYVAGVLASAAFVTERAHYHKGETSTFNQIKTYWFSYQIPWKYNRPFKFPIRLANVKWSFVPLCSRPSLPPSPPPNHPRFILHLLWLARRRRRRRRVCIYSHTLKSRFNQTNRHIDFISGAVEAQPPIPMINPIRISNGHSWRPPPPRKKIFIISLL